MPCLSWLVNARNRGVRGSGPPGFRRGLDATDRAGAFGPARSGWGTVLETPARELSRFRATPWPQIATVRPARANEGDRAVRGRLRTLYELRGVLAGEHGGTAQTSRPRRRVVRLAALCGADRTTPQAARSECAFSRARRGAPAASEPQNRKNRCSQDEVCRDFLEAIRGPNSRRRGVSAEDPRVYRPLMARRPSLGNGSHLDKCPGGKRQNP